TPPPSDTLPSTAAHTQANPPIQPITSTTDDGSSTRPRDARLLHLVLSNLGIQSYQERVPLQLLDFAYRYTSAILSDAQRLSSEGYLGGERATATKGRGGADGEITVQSLRQAIASRQAHSASAGANGAALPKAFMLEQAERRNRTALPKIREGGNRVFGDLQLPEEKYCLTGPAWNLREEWSSDEEGVEEAGFGGLNGVGMDGDVGMGGMDGEVGEEEGVGRMEDVFGEAGADVSMGQD
ncbi:TFIID-31kDa-domain-containing protein, partial [Teratosphaeria nubilosa]